MKNKQNNMDMEDIISDNFENPIFKRLRDNQNDLDYGNLNSIIDVDGWDEMDDDEVKEEFFNNFASLLGEGAETFDTIKKLCTEHPYALNNTERLKFKLEKIETILQDIEKMLYEL